MEDKQFQVDKMLDTLIDLASDEVNKAKQRGYFGKDFVEAAGIVISLANEKQQGTGGYGGPRGYGNYDRQGYGNYGYGRDGYGGYDTHEGYGNSEGYEEGTGEYGRGRGNQGGRGGRGERYGRSGERYG